MRDPALERMRRDMAAHALAAARVPIDAAWGKLQDSIRHRTGGTRASALAGLGAPKFRKVRRGPHYPPRGKGEAKRATKRYKHGDQLYITTDHPGGLLARGIFRSEGFHKVIDAEARASFERWKWRKGPGRG